MTWPWARMGFICAQLNFSDAQRWGCCGRECGLPWCTLSTLYCHISIPPRRHCLARCCSQHQRDVANQSIEPRTTYLYPVILAADKLLAWVCVCVSVFLFRNIASCPLAGCRCTLIRPGLHVNWPRRCVLRLMHVRAPQHYSSTRLY